MNKSEQIYQHYLTDLESTPRTNTYSSLFAECTTWTCETSPPSLEAERTFDWKEFPERSRSDHDTAACSYCPHHSHSGLDSVTVVVSYTPPSSIQHIALFLSTQWSRRRLILSKLLGACHTHTVGVDHSSPSVRQSTTEWTYGTMMVAEEPPVLPPLRPVSPFPAKHEI